VGLCQRDRDALPGLPGTRRRRAQHQVGLYALVGQPGAGRVRVGLAAGGQPTLEVRVFAGSFRLGVAQDDERPIGHENSLPD